jgi:hypothetical protein
MIELAWPTVAIWGAVNSTHIEGLCCQQPTQQDKGQRKSFCVKTCSLQSLACAASPYQAAGKTRTGMSVRRHSCSWYPGAAACAPAA